MRIRLGRLGRPTVLLTLSILGLVTSASVAILKTQATGFPNPGSPQTVPMGTTLLFDSNVRFFDGAPTPGTTLRNDTRIKLVDTNFDGHWDTGETVVYDTNNNAQYDYGEPVIGGTLPTIGQSLILDSKIKFVDTNLNSIWDLGETVVYEKSGTSSYVLGDPVIGATPPVVGGTLAFDSKVKYVDSGNLNHWVSGDSVVYDSNSTGRYANNTDLHIKYLDSNGNGRWDTGESVAYDANLNARYDSGETVLYGTAPASGASLKFDKLIKFLDPGKNGYWIQGDAIVYDSNNDNLYGLSEPVIVNSSPLVGTSLSTDPKVSYVDSNSNSRWDLGETVIYDGNSNGYFNASIDPRVTYYDSNANARWDQGETVIWDTNGNHVFDRLIDRVINGTSLPDQTPLSFDSHMRIVDANLNGHWDSGEPVVYDGNSNNVYDVADIVVSMGTPGILILGQILTERVLSGAAPSIGTLLKVDPKTKYVEANGNTVWDPGEAIIYDNNTSNVYDSGDSVILGSPPSLGSILRAPVIAGPVPPVGTLLKSDPKTKIQSSAGVWNLGEPVAYDGNGNNLYDIGEAVIACGAAPDGVWDQGEPVVYDIDSATNSTYASTDPVINGTAPVPGATIRGDYHIKFVDPSGTGHWVSGDTVIYDSNNNSLYDTGETVIAGTPPQPLAVLQPSVSLDPLGRIWISWNEKTYGSTKGTVVFFKMWNGTSWTNKQQVTNDPANVVDNSNFILSLPNQTMMILWSSNKTGHSNLFYRLYYAAATNPYPTSNPVQLTFTTLSDKAPSATTDRYGRTWVTWARQNTTQTGCLLICSNIYYKYFNGTAWSSDFPLPPATNPVLSEITPSIGQSKDGKIWIFWAINDAGTYNLYYSTTDGTIQKLPATGIPASSWPSNPTFVSEGTDVDQPFLVQSRDGALWVFYQSNDPTLPNQYIHYVNSTDGRIWNGPFALTTGSNDSSPTIVQMTDHKIWVFWSRTSNLSQIVYTTSNQISGVYDLGIRGITLGSRLVRSGWSVLINVTVTNYGDFGETGLLTLSLNSTVIKSTNQTFTPGSTYTLRYNWTSQVGFWGRYNLNATLKPAVSENVANNGDNSWSAGLLRISPPGDVDGNGYVDIVDAATLAIAYGKPVSFNPYADVDRDATPGSVIDILDAATLALYYGKSV